MKNLVEFILKNITSYPADLKITEEKEDDRVNIKIKVNQKDMPRVIGKEGKIIRSIRNLAKVAARKQNLWVNIELEEGV